MTQHQSWNKGEIVIDTQVELVQHLTDVNQVPEFDASLRAELKAQVLCDFVNKYLAELINA